jgi:broad specificity phosphatase PhoE
VVTAAEPPHLSSSSTGRQPAVRRLYLVRHAPTTATRAAAFPLDEPLDERGRSAAARCPVPACESIVSSPALRCRETAALAGLDPVNVDDALAECDFGSWAGRSLADVQGADPDAAAAWMTDPDAAPHGGESLSEFVARVGAWLDRQAIAGPGRVGALTHGGVVKAALVHALSAPLRAFWQFDVAPLSITELHAWDGRWTVTRVNGDPAARVAAEAGAA